MKEKIYTKPTTLENKNNPNTYRNNSVILENRNTASLTGINDVSSYDECQVTAQTDYGILYIKGENLQIDLLDTETGKLEINGRINAVFYIDPKQTNAKNKLAKLFK